MQRPRKVVGVSRRSGRGSLGVKIGMVHDSLVLHPVHFYPIPCPFTTLHMPSEPPASSLSSYRTPIMPSSATAAPQVFYRYCTV